MTRCKMCCAMALLTAAFASACAWAGEGEVCHVGAQLHLRQGDPEQTYMRHIKAFVEEGMAGYVMLLAYSLDDAALDRAVSYLKQKQVHFFIQERLDREDWHYSRETLARIQKTAGDLFLGVHWGELDSSGLVPEDYLPPAVYANPTRPAVKAAFVDTVETLVEEVHGKLGVPMGHSSAVLYHHLFAEAGVDIICSEIGENIPNVGMMVASNRGTARAYGRPWMIGHSTWWAPRGNAGQLVSPREGHTPWLMFTSLLGAAAGGADFVQLEVDWAAYPGESLFRGDGTPQPLLPWGRALKTLYSVTRAMGPRGETQTPFAILLGHENGWPGVGWRTGDVRAAGLYDGIRHAFMQTRGADLSLKVLDIFYPGFERCGWDPEYPGFLSESPLGTLDIVPDNLPAAAYGRYRCLVALGYHRMTPALRERLLAYVRGGGVLVCGDTLFLDEQEKPVAPEAAEPLTGCLVDFREDRLIGLTAPEAELDAIEGFVEAGTRDEWRGHWLRPVQLTEGRVVARMDGVPYLIENRLGAGRVFFVTALNMVGNDARRRGPEPFLYANILYHFLHTLEDHIGDGIAFSPWNSLEHVYNVRAGGTGLLLVMNHGDTAYRRDAVMANTQGYASAHVLAEGTWEDWQPGGPVDFTEDGPRLAWSFTIAPKSFVLFEFRP